MITEDTATVQVGGQSWTALHGKAAGVSDLAGDLRLEINGRLAGILHVENGTVSIQPDGDATALLSVDSLHMLLGALGGDIHPFVAFLQGHLQIEGDRAFALRILLGLRAGSPWSGLARS
jgi:putative sterol carrier protein